MDKIFNFEKSVSEFISKKDVSGYIACMTSFKNYLITQNIRDNNITKTYFQGIMTENILGGLNYYINSNNVTSSDGAYRYVACIKEYFLYLVQNKEISNDELMKEFAFKTENNNSYLYRSNKCISENSSIIESGSFNTFENVKDLITACDEEMGNTNILSKITLGQKFFNKYRSALIIKLIILTGATYQTITQIKESDLNLNHYSITLNKLTIHLPNNMIEQFRQYMIARTELTCRSKNNSINLFIEFDTSGISDVTTVTTNYLKPLIGRNDLTGLIKYTIINMIKKGINQNIITTFTGVGDTIYSSCQSEVNKFMDLKSSRYLDSKMRSIELFDFL